MLWIIGGVIVIWSAAALCFGTFFWAICTVGKRGDYPPPEPEQPDLQP